MTLVRYTSLLATLMLANIALCLSPLAAQETVDAPSADDLSVYGQGCACTDGCGCSDEYACFDGCCNACGPTFEATAAFLYLQPGSGDLEYGTLVNPLPAPSPHWVNQAIAPEMAPAFLVGARFFGNSCGDIQLNWTHLDTSDNDSFAADPIQFAGPPYEIGPDAGNYQLGAGSVDFQFDAVNLDVGHRIQTGPFQVRAFGGVQFARIDEELTGAFSSLDGTLASANTTTSQFTGVGPRLGMRAQRAAGPFDFLGEIGAAALIGRSESRIDFAAISPSLANLGITPPNRQSLASPDQTVVIPGIDTKLGAALRIPVGATSLIRIEGGYQAAVYVDAVSEYAISDVVVPSTTQGIGVFLRTAEHLQNNFTVHGPYLSASWVF